MHELKKSRGFIPKIDPEVTDAIAFKKLNVPYAMNSASQVMDIYYPQDPEGRRFPVIVYFHGGGFALGEKDDEDLEPMLCSLERGYVLVSAEYRLSGEAHFPSIINDAKAVIRFLRAHAEEYALDTEKIGCWGPSAGGWIVGMLGTTVNNPAFEDLSMGNAEYSSSVEAVVDWCGPCADFLRMDEMAIALGQNPRRPHSDAHSPESKFLGAPLMDVPELSAMASPIRYAHKDIPPFLIVHGTADEAVPYTQSVAFANALKEKAGEEKVTLYLAEGKPHHGNTWYTEEWVIDMALDFFDGILK